MLPPIFSYEIWCKKPKKKGKYYSFEFIKAFSKSRWQFAQKMKKKLLDKGYQVLIREVKVLKEEKLGKI